MRRDHINARIIKLANITEYSGVVTGCASYHLKSITKDMVTMLASKINIGIINITAKNKNNMIIY